MEKHQVEKVLNKTPARRENLTEPLDLEDIKAPEIFTYPPPPNQTISNPHKLADYYHSQMETSIAIQKKLAPIYEQFLKDYPTVDKWLKYAKFYECLGFPCSARSVFHRAAEFYGDPGMPQGLLDAIMEFEERQTKIHQSYKAYTVFGKEFEGRGYRSELEQAVLWQIKFDYACDIHYHSAQHDTWLKYIELLKSEDICSDEDLREIYQAAIAQGPADLLKRYWINYIRLWSDYALFEETKNIQRCREIYAACLDHIPHDRFTFSQVWLMYVKFEMGQQNLTAAMDILRKALEICPKEKSEWAEIHEDDQVVEWNSCRELFEIFLVLEPNNDSIWRSYQDWKSKVGDSDCSIE